MLYDIYLITNSINYKVYVGQAAHYRNSGDRQVKHGYRHRLQEHLHTAESGREDCPKLYNSIKKHGRDKFLSKCIEVCEEEFVDEREMFWIKVFNSVKEGYNAVAGGKGTKPSAVLIGMWKNPEYRKHQSEVHIKTWESTEYRANVSAAIDRRVRENGLPRNIYLVKDKGYEVTIKYKKKAYGKKFTSAKISMEDKLQLAIEWKEMTKQQIMGNNL
jgi:group I intron endonuclease